MTEANMNGPVRSTGRFDRDRRYALPPTNRLQETCCGPISSDLILPTIPISLDKAPRSVTLQHPLKQIGEIQHEIPADRPDLWPA